MSYFLREIESYVKQYCRCLIHLFSRSFILLACRALIPLHIFFTFFFLLSSLYFILNTMMFLLLTSFAST